MFPLCAIHTSNISTEEEQQVFFRSVVIFQTITWRFTFTLLYDFSLFLLFETPGFSELLWGWPPGPPSNFCSGNRYTAPPDSQLARAMTFACHAHGMRSSLTQQTFDGGGGGGGRGGGGGFHMNFSLTERGRSAIFLRFPKGDQQFNRVFHPVSTTPSPVS